MEPTANSKVTTACTMPPPLLDVELWSALDNEATAQVQAHLNQCPFCAAKLEQMRLFEHVLHKEMYRRNCPPTDHIADYLLGSLNDNARRHLEAHFRSCLRCREEAETLRAICMAPEALEEEKRGFEAFGVLHFADLEARSERSQPPRQSSPTPESLWQQFQDFIQTLPEHLVQILVKESPPGYAGFKGSSSPYNRVLSYTKEPVSVMLSLEKVVDAIKINGSIIDTTNQDSWRSGFAELISLNESQQRYIAMIDEDRTFIFNSIPAGNFDLNLYTEAGQRLRLQGLDIGV
jgi:hypothetical protein